jgi:hypothetical protein
VKRRRFSISLKALRELGSRKLVLFALYKAGLRIGYFKWGIGSEVESRKKPGYLPSPIHPILDLPEPDKLLAIIGSKGLSQLIVEADEIVDGRVRLFGGNPIPLNLTPPGELTHWMDYALGKPAFHKHPGTQTSNLPISDIKFIWEPARFGWTFTLGRAYYLTGDERYPEAFWRYFERFWQANPVNQGPNWESAQEVALRLIAFVFAVQIFASSNQSTDDKKSKIAESIANHAARISPTLIYARSQNNNHLLSEAAGLITASLALAEHPQSKRWSELGWKWFRRGLQTQIDNNGAYMQHSTNYHRLMLQLVLWVNWISSKMHESGQRVSGNLRPVILNLQHATRWLLALSDPESGRVPNLGPNDGAYIMPLTVQPFYDYRPVLQAASQVFLGEAAFEGGAWDEMSLWFVSKQSSGTGNQSISVSHPKKDVDSPSVLRAAHSWAYLRTAHFYDRPGHADQLHLDLWWRGLNIAQDAGTFLYNADYPWDNALTHTAVHNTVVVDNHQQMTPAGRFLYLDWAQADILECEQAQDGSWGRIAAAHDGYQRYGIRHVRSVSFQKGDSWLVEDHIQPIAADITQSAAHKVRLQWLLPDWDWKVDASSSTIEIQTPYGWVALSVNCQTAPLNLQLVRAGELLYGDGDVHPTWGWVSPTYGIKLPALSFVVTVVSPLPMMLNSDWRFPSE